MQAGDSVNNLFLPENSEKLKEEHDFMPSHNRVQEVWKMIVDHTPVYQVFKKELSQMRKAKELC